MIKQFRIFATVLMLAGSFLAALFPSLIDAQSTTQTPASAAEDIRSYLLQAQLVLNEDSRAAQGLLQQAQTTYTNMLMPQLSKVDVLSAERIDSSFDAASHALEGKDQPTFAAARAQIWTAILAGAHNSVEQAIRSEDVATAQSWLAVREFRYATRFSRPGIDATRTLGQLADHALDTDTALSLVQADLLDTYQARLTSALADLTSADAHGFAIRRAELAALAEGYFVILAPAYAQQRGQEARQASMALLTELRIKAQAGQSVAAILPKVEATLKGFRAAPLSAEEQHRRAGQLLRFLQLVPIEYGRGVRGGQVTSGIEIREAITFHTGTSAAFADLRDILAIRDANTTEQIATQLRSLGEILSAAELGTAVAEPAQISADTEKLLSMLGQVMPDEWQRQNSSADFDVIASTLDRMQAAVQAGQYDQAESARLEAYAFLETGPEARLLAFAPQHIAPIEELFWYGQGDQKGLAFLIQQRAPLSIIAASRSALDAQLAQAQKTLSGGSAPAAVGTNAAIIVFREGLEAVLILASLLGSLKLGEQRRLRRPIWWGAGAAFAASILTWIVARGALTALAQYGERLEAVVSLIAIAMLLLITNWFFHDVYWTGWMANFHSQKRRIMGSTSQWLGLAILGFTSIYREGFETVLFLQALVLEAGSGVVLGGTAVGLAATSIVGLIVFAVQAKLPYKKMLIYTGIMIGAVLLVMTGNTVHVLQVVGWLPTHPIRWLSLPYWSGMWFGLYPTWQGIGFQTAAGVFVIGSYYLAEWMHKRARARTAPIAKPVAQHGDTVTR